MENVGSHEHRSLCDCETALAIYINMRKKVLEENVDLGYWNTRHGLNAKDIKSKNTEFDIAHPLYKKYCCFTGTLGKMYRKDAMQIVADFGGFCENSVTKKTNFLILGEIDYSVVKDGKSSNLKKAEKYKLDGQDIEVISENVFYEMLN